ncbi:hypothetical protein RND81_02G188100 [Saponaria officinalis]|uniref:Uncharacterized protein n=1 Tax=Saponaria officinalis TaxID=3572 RepID=A0AAW1MUL5_SAPOF
MNFMARKKFDNAEVWRNLFESKVRLFTPWKSVVWITEKRREKLNGPTLKERFTDFMLPSHHPPSSMAQLVREQSLAIISVILANVSVTLSLVCDTLEFITSF